MAFSSTCVKKYNVFISFRGKDTRTGFTDFLYNALIDKGITTFIDECELNKGEKISSTLLGAIDASLISIIVFSENYADSRWCLDELNHIIRCKEERGQLVLPVFYKVNPTNIRNQLESYKAAFSRHKRRFRNDTAKLDTWRKSLEIAANLSGWDTAARSEFDLVKDIVKIVIERLQELITSCDYTKDIGMESNMKEIESLLRIGSEKTDTRVVGIWGMGGIGKTRLARVLFDRVFYRFSGSYFLENVKEEVEKHQPLDLQKRVFSELLNQKDLRSVTALERERLRAADVLLVLDNVDGADQLEKLAIDRNLLSPRSRIVVTSRDSQVLKTIGAEKIHEIEELSFGDAHMLFLSKAFRKGESPAEGYSELAKIIVDKYAKGNPLALTVLGRHLFERSIEEWKSQMELLGSTLHKEVQGVLRVSYDGLSENERDMFLDIACFFKGGDKNSAQNILAYKYDGVIIGVRVLIDKALVTISECSEIRMHDLIQKMGKEIVSQQSIDQPGERSRLWSTSDICNVLEDSRGTKKIQGVLLKCMSTFEITDSLTICSLVFKKMVNLWFLSIDPLGERKLMFPKDLDYLPPSLRYFRWNHCPLKSLPQSFNPKNLCELAIHGEKLEQIWNSGYKDLQKLKVLDLNGCWSLNQLPDLSHASNLMSLNLTGCCNLNQLPDLSSNLNLSSLNLTGCRNLNKLPDISRNLNLENLDLTGCCNLIQLPDLSRNSNLKSLNLSGCCNLNQLPDLSHNSNIIHLNLTGIQNLDQLPDLSSFSNLESLILQSCKNLNQLVDLSCTSNLKHLDLNSCSSIDKFPLLPNPSNIVYLDLSRTEIEEFPVSIECLTRVTRLQLDCCYGIKTLPSTLCKLKSLKILSIKENSKLEQFPEILEPMECLEELLLDGTGVKEFHPSIKNLTGLKTLSLQNCQKLEKLPDTIFNMQSLVSVNINGCPKLKFLPKLPFSIKCLEKLLNPLFLLEEKCQGTRVEQHVPRHLDATGCKSVERASKPWITFTEWLQLDRINVVAEFQSRVLAGNGILVSSEPKLRHIREVDIWFPGDEIMEWFCNRSEGSSVTVNPGWYNPNFIGFAACAILIHTDPIEDRVSLEWESRYTTERGEIITKSHRPFDKRMGKDEYHILMQSFHVDCGDISGATQVLFKVANVKKGTQTQVRKCGVRLLYRQDAEEFQRECQKEEISRLAVAQGWSSGEITQQQNGKQKIEARAEEIVPGQVECLVSNLRLCSQNGEPSWGK